MVDDEITDGVSIVNETKRIIEIPELLEIVDGSIKSMWDMNY